MKIEQFIEIECNIMYEKIHTWNYVEVDQYTRILYKPFPIKKTGFIFYVCNYMLDYSKDITHDVWNNKTTYVDITINGKAYDCGVTLLKYTSEFEYPDIKKEIKILKKINKLTKKYCK